MKYTLQTPITIANDTTSELTFRERVTGNDLRDVKFSDLQDPTPALVCKVASRLTGKPEAILLQMEMADQFEVTKLVLGFCTAGLKTGTDASTP
jgi:hypothetical protein